MKRSRKEQIQKLKLEKVSCGWEEADIQNSDLDPDMKAYYLNDLQYREYTIDQKIEDLEHEEAMLPLQLMLASFIIFATIMMIYLVSH